MSEANKLSDKRPARWRFLDLLDHGRGRFALRFPYTHNTVDRLLRAAAGLDEADKAEGAKLDAIIATGDKLEKWLAEQEDSRQSVRRRPADDAPKGDQPRTGTITKIHTLKKGKQHNTGFYRVEFDIAGKWAKTDLCPAYKNFERWKPFLKVGTILAGLRMGDATEVDGDSVPVPATSAEMALF